MNLKKNPPSRRTIEKQFFQGFHPVLVYISLTWMWKERKEKMKKSIEVKK